MPSKNMAEVSDVSEDITMSPEQSKSMLQHKAAAIS